ncbi:MAG: AAA family ATPase [Bacteroidales bacterium]|nr:AAA family ATPase [Bacteroidales bacterium]
MHQIVMAKEFNTSVTCNPKRHYMVDTTAKMKVFEGLINNQNYFTINRARQFGKSTSLNWIQRNLSDRYLVIPISFETESDVNWQNDQTFFRFFCGKMVLFFSRVSDNATTFLDFWKAKQNEDIKDFDCFSAIISDFCKCCGKKVVLTIDEVDKASNNDVFVRFLGMLRNMYLDREKFGDDAYTFWSVVLAGVYDVKNLKLKIRPAENHQFNSPWNVAAKYNLDMAFNPQEISTMLIDYENDHHIGFSIKDISEEIFKYTSGYPVLVSALCKIIDEDLGKDWSKNGVQNAVKYFLKDPDATILKTITKNIESYPDLKKLLRAITLDNFKVNYYADNLPLDLGRTFSFIRPDENSNAQIHNLIFQQVLLNYFIAEKALNTLRSNGSINIYINENGDINMPLLVERFFDTVKLHRNDEKFLEEQGRLLFLCYLKPVINGTGFYYIEPENDDDSRMDLVINYNRKEYIVELKIWRGSKYETDGRAQLSNYLNQRGLLEGYLVTFSFLKDKVLQESPEWIDYNGKRIFEAVI